MLTFDVPLDAVADTDLGARFRIGTVEAEVNSPTGFAMDGEVEDYLVRVKGLDYGDLPEPYATLDADDGARHARPPLPEVYLGELVDVDPDGQPEEGAGEEGAGGDDGDATGDDEDGVTEPAMLFQGEAASFEVQVVNETDGDVFLYGFIDWNADGDFDDAEEVQMETVSETGVVTLTYDVPLDATINTDLGARFRVGTVEDEVDQATGFAMDGEVEDYIVRVKGLDYGDLDSPVATEEGDDGPRHGVSEEPEVFFGSTVDVEPDGQPDPDAGETGAGDGADEDGIVEPAMLFAGEVAIFEATITNTSGNTAFIAGFVDFNDDGILDPTTEMVTTSLDGSGTVQLVFDVPLDAVINDDLAVRFRIGTVQSEIESPTGFAMDGEVEDYEVRVKGVDFGDLDDPYATLDEDDGPRHGVAEEPEIFLGSAPDPEVDGQPDPDAGETGAGDGTDEDGIVEPVMLFQGEEATFVATASNLTNEDAYLYAYADWNEDGAFDGPTKS